MRWCVDVGMRDCCESDWERCDSVCGVRVSEVGIQAWGGRCDVFAWGWGRRGRRVGGAIRCSRKNVGA